MALVVPQLLRGLVFATIVALVLSGLTGSRTRNALLIASAFGLLMALPLLQPNEAMPWAVRRVHFVELAISNFLFGLATVMILTAHRPWRIGRRLA